VWAQTLWNHAPKMEMRMQQLGAPWPRFEGHEMNDLLAYVREISGGPGGKLRCCQPARSAAGRFFKTSPALLVIR
jgi:hypothetical protein